MLQNLNQDLKNGAQFVYAGVVPRKHFFIKDKIKEINRKKDEPLRPRGGGGSRTFNDNFFAASLIQPAPIILGSKFVDFSKRVVQRAEGRRKSKDSLTLKLKHLY